MTRNQVTKLIDRNYNAIREQLGATDDSVLLDHIHTAAAEILEGAVDLRKMNDVVFLEYWAKLTGNALRRDSYIHQQECSIDDYDKLAIESLLPEGNGTLREILIEELLKDLPVRDYNLIVSIYLEGKTVTETAKELNISRELVSRRVSKILKYLREKFNVK